MIRELLKNSIMYFLPSALNKSISLLLLPVYTRVLNPADFGRLDLILVFANLITLTITLEILQGLAYFYTTSSSNNSKRQYASSAFLFTFLSYTVFLVLFLWFSKDLSFYVLGTRGLEQVFQIGVLYIWSNGIYYFLLSQFRWEFKGYQYAVMSVLMTLSTALVSIVLTYGFDLGLEGLLLGMLWGSLVGVSYGFLVLKKDTFVIAISKSHLNKMLSFSLPLVASSLSVFVGTYIDRIMINHFLTVEDVGLFGVAFRIAGIVYIAVMGFNVALTPSIYKNHHLPDTPLQLAKIFRIFAAVSSLLIVIIVLLRNEITVFATSPSYYSASMTFAILAPSILFSQMYLFFPGISLTKKTIIIFYINLLSAFLNLSLNYLFIPCWGIEGAASSTLITQFITFVLYVIFSQKFYYVPHNWNQLILAPAIMSVITLLALFLNASNFFKFPINIMAIVFCLMVILKTRLVTVVEFKRLFDWVVGEFLLLLKYRK
jgi:O-antigen/teichoic acid export membrane protein